MFLETTIIGLHFAADNIGLALFKFSRWASWILFISARVTFHFSRSSSSNVIDFGTSRKCVCFLLVRYNNLRPILHRFGDTAVFVLLTVPLFQPNFGGVSLHQIAHVGVSVSRYFKLFGRQIIFQVFQPMWSWYLNVTDRQTDRQTDGRTNWRLTFAWPRSA